MTKIEIAVKVSYRFQYNYKAAITLKVMSASAKIKSHETTRMPHVSRGETQAMNKGAVHFFIFATIQSVSNRQSSAESTMITFNKKSISNFHEFSYLSE